MGTVMRASLRSGAMMMCFLFLLAPAMGATIWVEAVDGDFPDFPIPWDDNTDPDFVLPEGDSTIDGDLVLPPLLDDTDDWFKFEVPEDFVLPEARFEVVGPDGVALEAELLVLGEAPAVVLETFRWLIVFDGQVDIDLTEETPEGGGPPIGTLPAGRYGMRFKTAEDPAYSITFTVEAVPEPSTVVLVLLGSLGLLARCQRCVASR